jgi:hypothetical protein
VWFITAKCTFMDMLGGCGTSKLGRRRVLRHIEDDIAEACV